MIGRLVKALDDLNVELEPIQISELLWLATRLPAPTRSSARRRATGTRERKKAQARTAPPQPATGPKSTVEEEDKLTASVFLKARASKSTSGGMKGRAIALPALDVMPERQRLRRALRPFARKRPSDWRRFMDEAATAEQTAENGGLVTPVYRPAVERWYDVVLVVEDVASMRFWADRIAAFATLLEDRGGFREVVRYSLAVGTNEFTLVNIQGARVRADRLGASGRQRLVLFVSDGTSAVWRSGLLPKLLHTWATQMTVAVVNPLPEALWCRTAIGTPDTAISSIEPGLRNAELLVSLPWWDFSRLGDRLAVPIVGLEPSSMERWSRTIMAAGGAEAPAILVSPNLRETGVSNTAVSEADLLDQFLRYASAEARLLATYLSAAPLTMPVMRLVQHAMLPDSAPAHLAEVFLSGLVERLTAVSESESPDRVQYEFVGDVRQRLQASLFQGEALQVTALVAGLLDRLSGDASRKTTFEAVVADARGEIPLPDDMQLLTRVSQPLLERLGYAKKNASLAPAPSREVGISPEATFTHPGATSQLSWSFDGQRLAILHRGGVSVASLDDSWSIEDLLKTESSWNAGSFLIAVFQTPQSAEGHAEFRWLLESVVRQFADAIADGHHAVAIRSNQREDDDARSYLVPVVPIYSRVDLGILDDTSENPGVGPLAVLMPGSGMNPKEIRKLVPKCRILDCSAIGSGEDWTRRRLSGDLGTLAADIRGRLEQLAARDLKEMGLNVVSSKPIPNPEAWTSCAWLSDGQLAVGRTRVGANQTAVDNIVFAVDTLRSNRIDVSPEDVRAIVSGQRPFVSLAGLGEHESHRMLCAVQADGAVYAGTPNSSGRVGPIQSGLQVPRRTGASASGAAFAYTHHGSGMLVWGRDFQRAKINGVERSPSQKPYKHPVRVTGFSFVEGNEIRLDVYWATGDIGVFLLNRQTAGDWDKNVAPERTWKVPGPVRAAASSPDGRLAVIAGEQNVGVWNRETARLITTLDIAGVDEYTTIDFSRDGRFLAVCAGRTTRVFATAKLPGVEPPAPREVAPPPIESLSQPAPESDRAFEYDVFVSYAHQDRDWTQRLLADLGARLETNLGRPVKFFFDSASINSEVLQDSIFRRIKEAAVFIAIASPSYLRSQFALRELAHFSTELEPADPQIVRYSRIFKVVPASVDREREPRELRRLRGYQFFDVGASGDSVGLKFDDLAYRAEVGRLASNIARVLAALRLDADRGPAPA